MATGSPPALWEGQQTRLLGFSAARNPGSVTLWSSAVRNLSTGFQLFGPSRLWRQVTVPPSPAQSHHSHCFSASPAFREASPRADWPSPGQVRTLPAGEVVEAGEGMAAKTGSPPPDTGSVFRYECQAPSAPTGIKSQATAVTDLQHILKGVQVRDQE